eukprot:6895957-Heterocapsa_arctica.AAC.1
MAQRWRPCPQSLVGSLMPVTLCGRENWVRARAGPGEGLRADPPRKLLHLEARSVKPELSLDER